jgi:outer membrane protein assembly factor BamB
VADGRVWVTTSVEQARSASLRALAFDVESGREIVNVEVFRLSNATLKNPKNSNASPTPIVEGNRVYLHFGADGTAAIDAATGALVWKAQFPMSRSMARAGRRRSTRIC